MAVTATLLLSEDTVCADAEAFARQHLQVVQVQHHSRSAKVLSQRPIGATLLLNFLSAPKVKELDWFRLAINFHPAPPSYPGVGSASRALYDQQSEHGVVAHLIAERFDEGPILAVRTFPILPEWGYKALWAESLAQCLELFKECVETLAHEWSGPAMTRKEYEQHPSFSDIAP